MSTSDKDAIAGVYGSYRQLGGLLFWSMRPHQWVKNLFVLAPLLFGMRLFDAVSVWRASLAFLSFCCLSSACYIINDIADAKSDRHHPAKRLRPIASGALSAATAFTFSLVLTLIGLSVAAESGPQFAAIATGYLALVVVYSLGAKRLFLIDTLAIASGFVLRVLGGAAAIGVHATPWLISCTFFLSLYIAFGKRRQELVSLADGAAQHRSVLRLYSIEFIDRVSTALLSVTILCYALYTVAPETVARFGTSGLFYGTIFVIYGLLRFLAISVESPSGGHDPATLVIKDPGMVITVVLWCIYNAFIIYSAPSWMLELPNWQ